MHKWAADLVMNKYKDIGELHAAQNHDLRAINRAYLQKVLQNVIFLSRQGLPLRGNWITSEDGNGGCERDSNFHQLLLLRANDDSNILDIMKRKTNKYTDHSIQDELIKYMAFSHLRRIAADIKEACYFALEADEVTDSSNKEQLVVCLRWVDSGFEAHEDFVGLHHVDDITTDTIVHALKDTLTRLTLSLSMCRAQCYDGAANMKKVASEIKSTEPHALYLHCYGHSLNLAVSDTFKNVKCLCDAMDMALEICKLLKYSPRRDAIFHKLHQQLSPEVPGIRNLCPTRWTVRASSLESIRLNYCTLDATWDEAFDVATQSDVKARINGVKAKMKDFDFLFGIMLAERILKHTDNLSKTLQATAMSAVEAWDISKLCVGVFKKLRSDCSFDQFWELSKITQANLKVNDPALPRKRKRPRRYESDSESYHPPDAKQHYKEIYFQVIDSAIVTIENRFQQKDYQTYSSLEQLVIKAALKKDYSRELNEIVTFYASDFNKSELETQLELLGQLNIPVSGHQLQFHDIQKCFQSLAPAQLSLLSQVALLVKLILLMPATNAVSERSASALRRVKTYLRTTMTQMRLNNVMVLHIHKHLTDTVDVTAILTEFSTANDERRRVFGSFQ